MYNTYAVGPRQFLFISLDWTTCFACWLQVASSYDQASHRPVASHLNDGGHRRRAAPRLLLTAHIRYVYVTLTLLESEADPLLQL